MSLYFTITTEGLASEHAFGRTNGSPLSLAATTSKEVQKMNEIGNSMNIDTFQCDLVSQDSSSVNGVPRTPRSNESIDPFTGLPIEAGESGSNENICTSQGMHKVKTIYQVSKASYRVLVE